MTDPVDIIREAALQSQSGDVFRMVCPFCNAKHEQSLRVVVKPDAVIYNCYRVKCKKYGILNGKYAVNSDNTSKKGFNPKICTEVMEWCPSKVERYLERRYELTSTETTLAGFRWLPETKRLWMPCYGSGGFTWGGCAKYMKTPKGKPKVVLYQSSEYLRLHYAPNPQHTSEQIIVCEDILSATKMSKYGIGVALLGTHMSDEMAVNIVGRNKSKLPIKLFLDYDAVDKAVKMKKRFSALAEWDIIINEKDPKDTPHEELERLL